MRLRASVSQNGHNGSEVCVNELRERATRQQFLLFSTAQPLL